MTYTNMAKDLSIDLCMVDKNLKKLKEMVIQKCMRLSTDEKFRKDIGGVYVNYHC